MGPINQYLEVDIIRSTFRSVALIGNDFHFYTTAIEDGNIDSLSKGGYS